MIPGRLAALCLALFAAACNSATEGPPAEIGVPPGSSLGSVAESLEARGVISSAFWLRVQARLQGIDRQLKPGIYSFTPGTPLPEILNRLSAGDEVTYRVTLPEGGTIWDLARIAPTRMPGISADSILAALRDTVLLRQHDIEGASAEGWLLPETFHFGGYATARQVVSRFLEARAGAWPENWQQLAQAAELDRVQILTLASIVEAEAQLAEELPVIAAVYRNRIRVGMPLQADPTIQYAFLVDGRPRKPRLLNVDYDYKSPYNTYLHAGLPPTPIGNPSTAAIEAVLQPAQVDFLYFVARGDGGHTFARSYAEHLRNIRNIRR